MRSRVPALLLLIGACTPTYPGDADGTFDVVGTLDQNTCGETALPAEDPLLFALELRSDGTGQAFWRRPATPVVSGTLVRGTYRFRFSSGVPVYDGDEASGTPGCALIQEERVTLSADAADLDGGESTDARDADAGSSDVDASTGDMDSGAGALSGIQGTDTIDLTVAPGFDCSPLLASAGGPFLQLPCGASYSLSGSPREPF